MLHLHALLSVIICSLIFIPSLYSQELIDADEELFYLGVPRFDERFSEATKYYTTPVSERRRGVDWWISDKIFGEDGSALSYEEPQNMRRARLYMSTRKYLYGISAEYAGRIGESPWGGTADIDFRGGRDANIEGCFSRDLWGNFSLGRNFGGEDNHQLIIKLEAPFTIRGLASIASSEAIELTGDNLYNPAWGYYNGEVRSSRVSRYSIPKLSARYSRPIGDNTLLETTIKARYGRRSLSRLGWYDAYNISPDYYRKLPSYISDAALSEEIAQVWRRGDSDYTQIAWDEIVRMNRNSPDGAANYVVEQQVERVAEVGFEAIFESDMGDGLKFIYGGAVSLDNSRYFKEMDDLLGGEYLLDIDQYIGDYTHQSINLQNDLRNPNRKICEGDRFGYDYTLTRNATEGVIGAKYRKNNLDISFEGRFGETKTTRIGHYEKERFAGGKSYGSSAAISLPTYNVELSSHYSLNGRHHLTSRLQLLSVAPLARDLFIQPQNANRIIDNPTPQKVSSISVGYSLQQSKLNLNIEGYYLTTRDGADLWQAYDDLTYTYSDVVVSGISTRSYGVEMVCDYRASRKMSLNCALSIGSYTYDRAPNVKLYDDSTMTLFSDSEADAVVGCCVGNAPQYLIIGGVDLFPQYGLILSLDVSYAGGRYVAPSFARRTERVIRGAGSAELEREIVAQSSLGEAFDLTLSLTRIIYFVGESRISITGRINNLLGDKNVISYGREANRVLRNGGSAITGSYYLQPNSYSYSAPRNYYISCSYLF